MSEKEKTVTEEELLAQEQEIIKQDVEELKDAADVVTVAQQEKEAGDTPTHMDPEQMREMAHMQLFYGIKALQQRLPKLSRRAVNRLVIAWMQLPLAEGKMPHNFHKELEKECFLIGQNVLASKYGILYEHVQQQALQERLAAEKASQDKTEEKETKEENKNDSK